MPLTFPSHAAAILPLRMAAPRVLPTAALVVGSCAPDFAYLCDIDGVFTHRLDGAWLFCLPAGLLALAWLDFVSSSICAAWPKLWGQQTSRHLNGRLFPRTPRSLASTALALSLGALTHIIWDGFTHRTRWPANVLYPTDYLTLWPTELTIHLANALQHVSTVAGLVVVWRWVRALPPDEATTPPPSRGRRAALATASTIGALALLFAHPVAMLMPWSLFWTTTQGVLLGLTAVAVLDLAPRRAMRGDAYAALPAHDSQRAPTTARQHPGDHADQ